jgi:hypothetical protein
MSDGIVQPGAPPAPPANVQEARTRLAALVADKERGAKLFAGDVETNRDYSQLTAMAARDDDSTVAAAMAGNLGDLPDSTVRMMAGTAGMLREIGIKEGIIEQVLKGHEVTAEEYKLTEAWKARQMKDPVFVKAYLSGEVEPREKMTLANIILSGGIKGQSGV